MIEIQVDLDLCQGHAQCEDAAAEVFEVRDDGLAHLLIEATDDPDLIDRVNEAAQRCPVEAIRLARAGATL